MSDESFYVEEKVYLVDVTIELPFEHHTEAQAQKRGERVREYVLQTVPGAIVTYSVWAKTPGPNPPG